MLKGQNFESNILDGQNPEFKILAVQKPVWIEDFVARTTKRIELEKHKLDQIAARSITISNDNGIAFSK